MKTVIEMAREAGFAKYMTDGEINWQMFERFAALVREDEREACAKVCEVVASQNPDTALTCAAAIRARTIK